MPTVSIIMPAYNSARFISESIESVLAQSYQEWELLICDDGSSDNTLEIVKSYSKKDKRIRVIEKSPEQKGPAHARNACISIARGRYIAFLDSDDQWTSDKLIKQLSFMDAHDLGLSFSLYKQISENGEYLSDMTHGVDYATYEIFLKHQTTIGCLTAIYDTQKCGKQLMPIIRLRQDYALWLKLLKHGVKAKRINENLALYRVRKQSASSNKIIGAVYTWRVYYEIETLGILKSTYYFLHYLRKHLLGKI